MSRPQRRGETRLLPGALQLQPDARHGCVAAIGGVQHVACPDDGGVRLPTVGDDEVVRRDGEGSLTRGELEVHASHVALVVQPAEDGLVASGRLDESAHRGVLDGDRRAVLEGEKGARRVASAGRTGWRFKRGRERRRVGRVWRIVRRARRREGAKHVAFQMRRHLVHLGAGQPAGPHDELRDGKVGALARCILTAVYPERRVA